MPWQAMGPRPACTVRPPKLGTIVKLIIAIVQPSRLDEVKEALTEVEVFRLTVLDCL